MTTDNKLKKLEPIINQKRDDIVYNQLLENIKRETWQSGEKLPSENELCKQFGVSRVTIRSAIQKLQSYGFVETRHGKGSFVCSSKDLFDFSGLSESIRLTAKEYKEISELREALEKIAISDIISKGSPTGFDAIKKAFHGMEVAALNYDYVELTKHDVMFHMAIIVASDNELFLQVMRIFHDKFYHMLLETNKLLMRDYPDLQKVKIHFEECLTNHRDLMDALTSLSEEAIHQQEKFHVRNKERVNYFFQKHHESALEASKESQTINIRR